MRILLSKIVTGSHNNYFTNQTNWTNRTNR